MVVLSKHYPGLTLERFLLEVRDILQKRTNNFALNLEQSSYSLSKKLGEDLEKDFLKGIPFSYLLEMSEFFHHKFYVNKNVLIPRPETEYLVDMIVREFQEKVTRVLDVGTGSGVILLSLLAHHVGASGVGVDISDEALKVAEINSHRLRLSDKAQMLKSDRLQKVDGTFDLIVSNPPYIKSMSQRELVQDSVDEHEPHDALYLPDDYYGQWFEDFFAEVRTHLKGTFFMEGHELEVGKQAEVLGRLGFRDVKVLNDMAGLPRYLKACFP